MLDAFPDQTSVFPGATVVLRIATDAPRFRIEFFRQGATLARMVAVPWIDATPFRGEPHLPSDDWAAAGTSADGTRPVAGWAGLPFRVPTDWVSGVYVAMFVEGNADGTDRAPIPDPTTADGRSHKLLLVVRNPTPGVATQLLYKLPTFTWQAYNNAGGGSVYQGVDVSLRRPGGGTGGTPWDTFNDDPWDRQSPRQTFAHWDAKAIAWLEGLGYRVDYCADQDVHAADALGTLVRYALVLSVGHDEYWSEPIRATLEAYVAAGGNLACLSGNVCWWRAELSGVRLAGQQTIRHWSELGRPEDALTGVSWRNGGEDDQDRPAIGYVVQHTDRWPFEGTRLSDGDTIGAADGLVGYECDGTPYDKDGAFPFVPRFEPADATPYGLTILGTADLASFGVRNGNAGATMTLYSRSGTVFTAATTDWVRVAAAGDTRVGTITRTVVDRLGGNPKGFAAIGLIPGAVACDGFFTPDDGYRHVIVGDVSGAVTEQFFHPVHGIGQVRIASFPGLCDVAGFWSADDGYRHALVVTASGEVWEVYFHPRHGIGQVRIAVVPGAVRVAGFYSADDGYRHALVSTTSGAVREVFFSPRTGIGEAALGTFPGLVDLGGFYTADDGHRHAIVAQRDGTITEVFYHPRTGIGQARIGVVPGVSRLSGYAADDDAHFSRRVVVATADQLHELRFSPRAGIVRAALYRTEARDVGGWYTTDDGRRHVAVLDPSGRVHELFFRP